MPDPLPHITSVRYNEHLELLVVEWHDFTVQIESLEPRTGERWFMPTLIKLARILATMTEPVRGIPFNALKPDEHTDTMDAFRKSLRTKWVTRLRRDKKALLDITATSSDMEVPFDRNSFVGEFFPKPNKWPHSNDKRVDHYRFGCACNVIEPAKNVSKDNRTQEPRSQRTVITSEGMDQESSEAAQFSAIQRSLPPLSLTVMLGSYPMNEPKELEAKATSTAIELGRQLAVTSFAILFSGRKISLATVALEAFAASLNDPSLLKKRVFTYLPSEIVRKSPYRGGQDAGNYHVIGSLVETGNFIEDRRDAMMKATDVIICMCGGRGTAGALKLVRDAGFSTGVVPIPIFGGEARRWYDQDAWQQTWINHRELNGLFQRLNSPDTPASEIASAAIRAAEIMAPWKRQGRTT